MAELRFIMSLLLLLLQPGMKLACMLAFPPEILSRAKELIPILTTNLKV